MTYNSLVPFAAEAGIVSDRHRILFVCNPNDSVESLPEALRISADVETVHNPLRALARIARLLRDQDVAKKLRASRDAQAIYSVLALPPASAA